jgi:hypothetical protein
MSDGAGKRKLPTEAQVCRILKGAKRAGVENANVYVLPTGTVRISRVEPEAPIAPRLNAEGVRRYLGLTRSTFQAVEMPDHESGCPGVWTAEALDNLVPVFRPCWLYFIESGEHVKIGITANTEMRLAALQTSNPSPLTLAFRRRACRHVESAFHHALRFERAHGEWFRKGFMTQLALGLLRDGETPETVAGYLDHVTMEEAA